MAQKTSDRALSNNGTCCKKATEPEDLKMGYIYHCNSRVEFAFEMDISSQQRGKP